jgi:hypothetical protein
MTGRIKVFDMEQGPENQLPLIKEYEVGSARIFTFAVSFVPLSVQWEPTCFKVHSDMTTKSVCLIAATSSGNKRGFVLRVWADELPLDDTSGQTGKAVALRWITY